MSTLKFTFPAACGADHKIICLIPLVRPVYVLGIQNATAQRPMAGGMGGLLSWWLGGDSPPTDRGQGVITQLASRGALKICAN